MMTEAEGSPEITREIAREIARENSKRNYIRRINLYYIRKRVRGVTRGTLRRNHQRIAREIA